MKDTKSEPDNVDDAVNAVLAKKELGQLQSSKRNSLASRLRGRITDLKTLNADVSAATIASELTQAGFKVSASTVQRVLREGKMLAPTKRKKSNSKETNIQTTNASSAPSTLENTSPAAKDTTDAEALFRKIQEENGMQTASTSRKTASFQNM